MKLLLPFLSSSHSHSDKDHNISAAFEVADISLALISLGHYSWGETSMVWVGQVFCQLFPGWTL